MISTPSHLRKINERRIFESVLRLRRASRAQLSRISGISSPTVGRIVDDLLTAGILMESAGAESQSVVRRSVDSSVDECATQPPAASVGRPSTSLELDNRRYRFLAIQLGVRQTRLARTPIALPNEDVWEEAFDTPSEAGAWVTQLALKAVHLPVRDLSAVIVSVPGIVDEANGRVLLSPNLPWTESIDFKNVVGRAVAFGVPVIIVQEIRALALGQYTSNTQSSDLLLVDFGNGVGGAAMIDGKLYAGPLPINSEIGHTPVLGNTRLCGCGSVGCVETLVSRRGLLESAQRIDSSIASWPDLVRHSFDDGMPDWLKYAMDAAAVCISGALNNFGLRHLVVTGALSELPEAVMEHLAQAVRADAMWARFGSVEICTAPRRRLAGMVHAAISQTVLRPTVN